MSTRITSAQLKVVSFTVCHFIPRYPASVCTSQLAARVNTSWQEEKSLPLPKFEPQ